MIGTQDVNRVIGADVVDGNDDKVGKVSQVYLDADTNNPTWASVRTGLFGLSETLVPIQDATFSGDVLRITVDKDRVKNAPRVEPDQDISPEEQDRLYDYYEGGTTSSYTDDRGTGTYTDSAGAGTAGQMAYTETTGTADDRDRRGATYGTDFDSTTTTSSAPVTADADYDRSSRNDLDVDTTSRNDLDVDTTSRTDRDYSSRQGVVGDDVSGPETDNAMTRSEERLHIGTERVATSRARLVKYVVTENQTVTVPVTREEVRIEREPITDANRDAAYSGGDLTSEEHEVVLTEERPVVDKETVPVERVRLDVDQVTENRTITEEVRKEQIDVDGVDGTASSGRTDTATSGYTTDRTGVDRDRDNDGDRDGGLVDRAKNALDRDRDGHIG